MKCPLKECLYEAPATWLIVRHLALRHQYELEAMQILARVEKEINVGR